MRRRTSLFARHYRRDRKLFASIFLACSLGASTACGQYETTADTDAIFWSKNEFTIPFHVDANGKQPAEVQLEISKDGGNTWSLYARDSLQSRQFRFASGQDGLYLFRIKTVDESGLAYDPGGQPLKVVVDTQTPELNLSIDTDPQGRMIAKFSIADANPRIDSLRLEFQTEQNNRWKAIPIETEKALNNVVLGRGVWEIPASARQLVVRLIAKDAAGNEAEVTRLPLLPKTAIGSGGLQLASGTPTPRFGQNYAQTSSDVSSTTVPSQNAPANTTFGKPYSAPTPAVKPNPPAPQTLPVPSASMTSSTSRYSLQPMASESAPNKPTASNDETLFLDPSLASPSVALGNPSNSQKPFTVDSSKVEPPLGTAQSIEDKPFYSKSRAFSLDYEVDSQAASPVASIELWGTTDGGKLWERWGTDPDGASPFDIKVETDGLFGFRMVVVGSNGLAGNRPQNGDNADAWIHVDTDLPSARIISALYGKGVEANSLVIEYSASDHFFGERPITLSYSELPTGPWTTISNGLQNTGRYVWLSDPTLPRRVYLKLEAFDQAGNVAEHRLDVPVDIEGLAPRGRIQGFRPITQ
jgi:hypothetical protein